MRPWIGVITLVAGVLLLITTRRERTQLPPWFPRLAVGVVFLGSSTLLLARGGTAFSILSALCSLVAIVLFGSVIWTILRRR